MHEELKKEFEERFTQIGNCNRFNGKFIVMETIRVTTNVESDQLWQWFESKLPKEVEIKLVEEQTYYRCPNCGIWLSNADGSDEEDDYTDNYCPNCGAKINWK